jgi:hypothetical protein
MDADDRPAVSGMIYTLTGDRGGVLILKVPSMGSLHIHVHENPLDPQGKLEVVGLSLGS